VQKRAEISYSRQAKIGEEKRRARDKRREENNSEDHKEGREE